MQRLFLFQFPVQGKIHCHEARKPSDGIGNRLRKEHSVYAKPQPWKQYGQRGYDHRLAQQGKEDCMAGIPQGGESGLSRKLERHEKEAEKVQAERAYACLYHGRVLRKDRQQKMRA